jgi:hypothetical protein
MGYWNGFDSSVEKFYGNTILVKITDHKYISIGQNIYEFTTDEIITDYVSPIRNYDVPYPIANSKHYVYFYVEL